MRVVVQRVSRASVTVEGKVVGAIERGLCLLVGIAVGDGPDDVMVAADKIAGLRIFSDATDRMNLSLEDVGGSVLAISQFTLLGEVSRGRRPSFTGAAPPEIASPLFDQFVDRLRSHGLQTSTGVFGAKMEVALVNDGPVTLVIEVRKGQVRQGQIRQGAVV